MLFSETIIEIEINNKNDLKNIVNHLKGFSFAKDSTSKEHKEHEYFCLYIFLIGSYKMNRLPLPVRVISRESPDFTIIYESNHQEIGLEHTKATLESFKIAKAELKKYPEGSMIELCYYSPFVKIPKKQSNIGIVSPKGPLKSGGWNDDQVEQEWAEIMLNTIKRKTELLNGPHFEIQQRNALFIEDESPVVFMKNENDAIQLLKQKHEQITFPNYTFDNIHIFSNCTLISDVFGKCIKTGLRKKELPNI
jgi:hypothetical protein